MADASAVGRFEAGDEFVEEPTPIAGRASEEAVHGRRQPKHLQVLGKRGRSPVRAVDAHLAAVHGGGGADPNALADRMYQRAHCPLASAADACHISIGRTAQAWSRCQQRNGFHQIGLARTVRAGEHDWFGAKR